MTDSNRTQVTYIAEVTLGTTPGSPAMTALRLRSEDLNYAIDTIRSDEIRATREVTDAVNVGARNSGGFNFELSYGAFDDFIAGAMFNTWTETAEITNSASDTEITQVTDSSDTFTVASGGGSFKAGHLIRTSGFTNAANNGLFRVASSTGTTVVAGGTPTLTDEAAPPLGARIKVVGFRGASGDITATSTGLGSTALDFTTLGLQVGQWIKIGGSTAGEQFATAALNDWARVTAIAATALTLDNRPTGWTTDSGTSKTITVYVGDVIKVGTTKKSFTIEKAYLGQDTPKYIVFKGMVPGTLELNFQVGQILNGRVSFLGTDADVNSASLDASPTAAPTNSVMNAINDIARISENGSAVTGPNYIQSMTLTINNALREQVGIGTFGLVGIGAGDAEIQGNMTTYFGSYDLYERFINNTASSLFSVVRKSGKGYVFSAPNVKLMNGTVQSGGRNQDVLVNCGYMALYDSTTATSFQIDRFEEFYQA